MDIFGWIELAFFLGALLILTKPTGLYLARVLEADGKTFLDPVLKPVELRLYQLIRVNPGQEQEWKPYAFSLLLFSLVGLLFTYAVLRLQHVLPLNPQGWGPVRPDLA
ncbi:MAG TPA: potassium-transporting ATPase subunit KdpA, partial [Candidatus Aminicenantes bacterium]|nr:potassium-transporting ATPase subunit KdpA [Candidatus Aminicenantes bacterium]